MRRRWGTTVRLTALAAAGVLAVLVPVPPDAAAQPVPGPGQPEDFGFAKPPPLPADYPTPRDFGRPDRPYEQKTACIQTRFPSLDQGVVLPNKPWGQNLLRFDDLHDFATGKGQTVVVIDTGVNRHDFLGDRLSGGGDYVVDGGDGLADCDGHGTEVAGIIAANPANPEIGFKGIAPDANIVSIRQSSANFAGKDPNDPNSQERNAGNLLTLAQAIVRAADRAPGGVINMSVDNCRRADAGLISDPEMQVHAALKYAVEVRDAVPVVSAGNLNEDQGCDQQNGPDANRPTTIVTPPWFSDYVLSVAAMHRDGNPAEFSVQGPWVSVAAPGTDIISLDPGNPSGLANRIITKENKLVPIQGTSFAAPYVAGLAALVRERFPELSARQVMDRIMATAAHPAATGGRDTLVGYGMINPIGALTTMVPPEQGIPPDGRINIPFVMHPPVERDWTPMTVALVGTASGVGLLLITLFVVHTVRRIRRREQAVLPPLRS
jgi:membrane-anchored mycosin MYCP